MLVDVERHAVLAVVPTANRVGLESDPNFYLEINAATYRCPSQTGLSEFFVRNSKIDRVH